MSVRLLDSPNFHRPEVDQFIFQSGYRNNNRDESDVPSEGLHLLDLKAVTQSQRTVKCLVGVSVWPLLEDLFGFDGDHFLDIGSRVDRCSIQLQDLIFRCEFQLQIRLDPVDPLVGTISGAVQGEGTRRTVELDALRGRIDDLRERGAFADLLGI